MEVAQTTFQERISELIIEHIVADVSVTQSLEDLVEVAQTIFLPQVVGRIFEHVQPRTMEQVVQHRRTRAATHRAADCRCSRAAGRGGKRRGDPDHSPERHHSTRRQTDL